MDESRRGSLVTIGVYISKSYLLAYEGLIEEYKKILGLVTKRFPIEIKFSNVLNKLGQTYGILPRSEIMKIFKNAIDKISSHGYGIGIIISNDIPMFPKTVEEYEYIMKSIPHIRKRMKTKGYTPSRNVLKFLKSFLLTLTLHLNINEFVLDHNFMKKKELKFIKEALALLGTHIDVRICANEEEKGIAIADFIAGISKYLDRKCSYGITNKITVFSTP